MFFENLRKEGWRTEVQEIKRIVPQQMLERKKNEKREKKIRRYKYEGSTVKRQEWETKWEKITLEKLKDFFFKWNEFYGFLWNYNGLL